MRYSVITINYNNRAGLRSTIESVLSQSCTDYEYIVIDGGSTDGSVDVIKESAGKIAFWVSENDRGIYHAMNKGVAQAHGDYCIFMNSGDSFYDKTVLERLSRYKKAADVIVGKVAVDKDNYVLSPPPPKGELTFYHLFSGSIPHQGSFIRTDLLRKYPYDETLKISSDWKFFVQTLILDNGSINYVDEFVAQYNLGGLSASNPEMMRKEKESVLSQLFPPRVLADYKQMKRSECLTQMLTPQLRNNYGIDKLTYRMAKFLLRIRKG